MYLLFDMGSKTAMRDSDGDVVFVDSDGRYVEHFPSDLIVRRSVTGRSNFIVYGFVGTDTTFEQRSKIFEEETEALNYVNMIYGRDDVDMFKRDGEVFEVEVHELDA